MRLTGEHLTTFGTDRAFIHSIETVFPPSDDLTRLGIAVSGGGDSMALLHLAWRWSQAVGVSIEAVTVDHGLRAAAPKEAAMVAAFCDQLNVPHTTVKWDGAKAQGNIAALGRNARYALIGGWAQSRAVNGVLLGHTADDIAETFLMRIARKSGVDGLAAMNSTFERSGITWGRPLLNHKRQELRDYLTRQALTWVDDPTNEDESYERPKARKTLAALKPLGITRDVLKTVAVNMSAARDTLDHYTLQEADRVVRRIDGDIVIDTLAAPTLPSEIRRRLLVAALRFVGGGAYAPRNDAILDLEAGLKDSGKHTLAGCIVSLSGGNLRVTREYNAVKGEITAVNALWDNRWRVDGGAGRDFCIRALGDALKEVPDWRETGLPRASLLASPAVFDGETLISAPIAGLKAGYSARIVADFKTFLVSR